MDHGHATSLDLSGKRALITGAGRGIGKNCAETLAALGAHVTLTSRTASEIEVVAQEIIARGGSADTATFDTADLETMHTILAPFEAWDILVNNAGTNTPQPIWDITPEDYDRVMNINVRGALFVAQAVVKKLLAAQKPGSIIQMSSQMGHIGGKKRSVYCASKHAIEGMSKAMAADLAEYNIRVNCVCPTFVETPMTRPFLEDPSFAQEVKTKILLGRYGQTQEIADAVAFLASDASSLMTGSALMVDGGWTAI